jgi:hypothetical protein
MAWRYADLTAAKSLPDKAALRPHRRNPDVGIYDKGVAGRGVLSPPHGSEAHRIELAGGAAVA